MTEIIVVDDEADIRELLTDYLGMAGFAVRAAESGPALRRLIGERAADLVVLDLNMPGEDGLTLARWLREHHDIGIIMLTAAGTAMDRVVGLEVGADDYLVKPFAPSELAARIKAVLRRRPTKASAAAPADGTVPFGPYRFAPERRRLLDAAGEPVALTATELDLVAAFALNPGKALSRDDLLDLAPARGDEPFDRSIDNRITRLRRKLERDPAHPELIKTIRGTGYLFPG